MSTNPSGLQLKNVLFGPMPLGILKLNVELPASEISQCYLAFASSLSSRVNLLVYEEAWRYNELALPSNFIE